MGEWGGDEKESQVKFKENISVLTFGREYVCIVSENNSETTWNPVTERNRQKCSSHEDRRDNSEMEDAEDASPYQQTAAAYC